MNRALAFIVLLALASVSHGAQVLFPKVSPNGVWRVEIADHTSASKFELWATPTAGGARRKIGHAVPSDHDVFEYLISADSTRVVYRQGRTATGESKLYSTPIDAPTGSQISQPLPVLSRVAPGISLWRGGTHVRYQWEEESGGVGVSYAVPVGGGSAPIRTDIFSDGFESGSATRWN